MPTEPGLLLLTFVVPGEAPSTLNLREHWSAAADRAKRTHSKVKLVAPRLRGSAPLCIRLTRTGYRRLDGDNLQGALKAHRDAVAKAYRFDDACPLVEWLYAQETDSDEQKHGVVVEVFCRPYLGEWGRGVMQPEA